MITYRIKFEPKVGQFTIEVDEFLGLFWQKVHKDNKVHYFTNYDDAVTHVKAIGLDKCGRDATQGQPWDKRLMQTLHPHQVQQVQTPPDTRPTWSVPPKFV